VGGRHESPKPGTDVFMALVILALLALLAAVVIPAAPGGWGGALPSAGIPPGAAAPGCSSRQRGHDQCPHWPSQLTVSDPDGRVAG
jgi:hypothetical protein